VAVVISCTALAAGCRTLFPGDAAREPDPLPVTAAAEEVVVAAWSEPKELPPAGGQAQILVRAQKRGGAPFPGVEVRLSASGGDLFSGGKVLVTDTTGRTRDRLTARKLTLVTVNAGGTVYRFRVPLRAPETQ
jgi:hypothetical protein